MSNNRNAKDTAIRDVRLARDMVKVIEGVILEVSTSEDQSQLARLDNLNSDLTFWRKHLNAKMQIMMLAGI